MSLNFQHGPPHLANLVVQPGQRSQASLTQVSPVASSIGNQPETGSHIKQDQGDGLTAQNFQALQALQAGQAGFSPQSDQQRYMY